MATERPSSGVQDKIKSLQITLPFSVVQVWNDLEVGQVVKLPAKDEQDGDMSLQAQRDGSNNISLRFIHTSLTALADTYAADINIRKVSLSKLDSSHIPLTFPTPPTMPSTGLSIPQKQVSPTHQPNTDTSPSPRPLVSQGEGEDQKDGIENVNQLHGQDEDSEKDATQDPNDELIGQPRVALSTTQLLLHSKVTIKQEEDQSRGKEDEPSLSLDAKTPKIEPEDSKPVHDTEPEMKQEVFQENQAKEIPSGDGQHHAASLSEKMSPVPTTPISQQSTTPIAAKIIPVNTNGHMEQNAPKRPHEADLPCQGPPRPNPDDSRHDENKMDYNQQPAYKKKRGPRQYKCDVCGAEFVYAGVYSKHMWKHNRYNRGSPPGDLPPSSFSQGLPNLIQNMLNPQGLAVPIDMSSPAKHTSIPQQLIQSITGHSLAKASLTTTVNTSAELKHHKNGLDGQHNDMSGDSSDDLGDDTAYGSDETLAEVHMEKKEGAGYDCWICGRPFTYKPPFIRHMRAAHEIRVIFDENRASNKTGKIFTCKLCSQSFLYQLPFEKHMKMIHGTNMDSASSKFVDIRDQRCAQLSPLTMGATAQSLAEHNKIISATMAVLAHQNKVNLNSNSFDHISSTTFQNLINSSISAAAAAATSPQSLTVNKTSTNLPCIPQSLACNTSLPGLTHSTSSISSTSPPTTSLPSLSNSPQVSPPGPQKKDSDYMIVDSSGNHVMFGERLQCFVCSEKFTDKRLYLVHMQNEHGIQPKEENSPFKAVGTKTGKVFTCHVCQRRFSYKGPYEKHMRSHGINLVVLDKEVTQESLYCEICGKVFAYQLPYEKHMRNIHNIEAPMKNHAPQLLYRREQRHSLQCEICFRNFSTMQSLVKHVISKHQNHLGGGVMGPTTELNMQSPNMESTSSISQAASPDLSAPENESGSESEELPQRVYLDPHSVLKDLSSIIPPEDVEMGTVQRPGPQREEEMEVDHDQNITNGKDPAVPRIEPSRIHDPDSTMSMIKCEICKKMFRYKIAFSKHMHQSHPGESENANLELVNNNNEGDLDYTKGHFDHEADLNRQVSPKDFPPITDLNKDVDMPVDYSSPKKKMADLEDGEESKPKSFSKEGLDMLLLQQQEKQQDDVASHPSVAAAAAPCPGEESQVESNQV